MGGWIKLNGGIADRYFTEFKLDTLKSNVCYVVLRFLLRLLNNPSNNTSLQFQWRSFSFKFYEYGDQYLSLLINNFKLTIQEFKTIECEKQ